MINGWDHTDATKLREVITSLEQALRKMEPEAGETLSLESSAMIAQRIFGYRDAIKNLLILADIKPQFDLDPAFVDFNSTKKED